MESKQVVVTCRHKSITPNLFLETTSGDVGGWHGNRKAGHCYSRPNSTHLSFPFKLRRCDSSSQLFIIKFDESIYVETHFGFVISSRETKLGSKYSDLGSDPNESLENVLVKRTNHFLKWAVHLLGRGLGQFWAKSQKLTHLEAVLYKLWKVPLLSPMGDIFLADAFEWSSNSIITVFIIVIIIIITVDCEWRDLVWKLEL